MNWSPSTWFDYTSRLYLLITASNSLWSIAWTVIPYGLTEIIVSAANTALQNRCGRCGLNRGKNVFFTNMLSIDVIDNSVINSVRTSHFSVTIQTVRTCSNRLHRVCLPRGKMAAAEKSTV